MSVFTKSIFENTTLPIPSLYRVYFIENSVGNLVKQKKIRFAPYFHVFRVDVLSGGIAFAFVAVAFGSYCESLVKTILPIATWIQVCL